MTSSRSTRWTPFAAAATGALVSLFAAGIAWRIEARTDDMRFDRAMTRLVDAIAMEANGHYALLRSAAGLMEASEEVTAAEFAAYVRAVGLAENYPSAQGIGWTRLLRPPPSDAALSDADLAAAAPVSAITFLEPQNARNRRALGFDMFSEATRRDAMLRAAATGAPAASGPVVLVQETEIDRQWGFLLYVPVGARDGAAGVRGWAYMAFRGRDFLAHSTADGTHGRDLSYSVRDAAAPSGAYYARDLGGAPANGRLRRRTLDVGGRSWIIEARPSAEFARLDQDYAPLLILAAGLLATAFAALALAAQQRALARAHAAEAAERALKDHAEALLGEVNHRVANSLQLTSALLALRARTLADPAATAALGDAQRCIEAVGLVHRRLYTSSNIDRVELCAYLKTLIDEIRVVAAASSGIAIRFDGKSVDVTPDQAVAFGVVVAELLSNALKYAYAPGETGVIDVRLAADDAITVVVEDRGRGKAAPEAAAAGTGFGTTIIKAMAQKLGAAFRTESADPGFRAVLTAPLPA